MATATTTKRSTAAKKRSTAAKKPAATQTEVTKTPLEIAAESAEKAVLVPVGATLIARDNVVSTLEGLRVNYSTPEKAQRELRRFERRGVTARNRFERQVKKTRTRVERELRQRRTRVQRVLKQNRTRVEREFKQRQKDLDTAQARVENLATDLSAGIQKRFSSAA